MGVHAFERFRMQVSHPSLELRSQLSLSWTTSSQGSQWELGICRRARFGRADEAQVTMHVVGEPFPLGARSHRDVWMQTESVIRPPEIPRRQSESSSLSG